MTREKNVIYKMYNAWVPFPLNHTIERMRREWNTINIDGDLEDEEKKTEKQRLHPHEKNTYKQLIINDATTSLTLGGKDENIGDSRGCQKMKGGDNLRKGGTTLASDNGRRHEIVYH